LVFNIGSDRCRALTEIAREKEHEVCTDEGPSQRLPERMSMRYVQMKGSHRDCQRAGAWGMYRWRSLTEIARENEHEVCTDEGPSQRLPERMSMRYVQMKVPHRDCKREWAWGMYRWRSLTEIAREKEHEVCTDEGPSQRLSESRSMRYVYRWRALTEIAREKEYEVCTDEGVSQRLPERRSMKYVYTLQTQFDL
jgi:hypothetical protein